MNFNVSKKIFEDAIARVSLAVPAKTSTPILSGILFKITGNNLLHIETTDNCTTIKTTIHIQNEDEDGKDSACVVPAKNLLPIIHKLGGDIIIFKTDNQKATIKSDAASFELPLMDADDFPETSGCNADFDIAFSSNDFKNLVKKTTFAVMKDDSRPVFQGVNFILENGKIFAVATNTHRLAKFSCDISGDFPDLNFIVPAAALNAVAKILPDDTKFFLSVGQNKMQIFHEDFIFITRLIDGNFPSSDKVIAVDSLCSATVDLQEFRDALDRVNLISRNTEYNTVALKFNNEGLEMYANSYGIGSVVEHLNAAVEGEIDIAFNISYLLDFVKVISSEELVFNFNIATTPAKVVGSNDNDFIYIVTPVRR